MKGVKGVKETSELVCMGGGGSGQDSDASIVQRGRVVWEVWW